MTAFLVAMICAAVAIPLTGAEIGPDADIIRVLGG